MKRAAILAAMAGLVLVTGPAFAASSCPALRWVTLGTAGGPIPTPERAEPSNLLIAGEQYILVDTGDGAVNQLARAGVTQQRISAVFLSHHHLDHTGGLPAVIGLRWMNNIPGKLKVYGPPGTREIVDGALLAMQPQSRVGFGLGAKSPSPASSVEVIELTDGAQVEIGGLKVTVTANSHFDHPGPKQADEPLSFSYRFDLGSRSITYTGDTGPSDAVTRLAKGSDMLVSEVIALEPIIAQIRASRPDMSDELFGQMRKHLSTHHITAADIGMMAAKADVKRVVLTHFATPPGPIARFAKPFRADIAPNYHGPVAIAQDLSSFEVACR
ncbi:MAG: MBL fold metallo-hydrolase [Novosphingobium sp.]